MARKIYTDDQISDALAVFAVTGSYREAAASVGCSITTVKKWEREHDVSDSGDKTVEERVAEKAADIRERMEQARQALIDRILYLAPREDDLKAVATTFGIVTDKALLSRGQPTSIVESVSPGDARRKLHEARDELAARRKLKLRQAA